MSAQTGIVHLGLGAFARAFVCPFVADAMAASGGDWGITGVSLRSTNTRDALRGQDWAYSAVALGPDGEKARRITILNDVLVAPEDPAAVLDLMSDPKVKIVTLTVTEKGYCHHPATGALDRDHIDIAHDIDSPRPRSAPGYLVRALQRRRERGLRPFTVLSCDNLPANGDVTRRVVTELARFLDPELAAWIAAEGKFPSTMVDRITPATTQGDIDRVAALVGWADAAPVLHEPFAQWAVEDDFVDGARPDLAAAGVELVDSVAAHETMKLRLLNGTHSALAYTGYLAGHGTIADSVADPVFTRYLRRLWAEIIPTVDAPPGTDLHAYTDTLFDRYANPAIRHRTWQIAMDGSQKLPQRLLGTLGENLTAGRASPALFLAVAAWMRYVGGIDEAGDPIDVRDPLAARLAELWRSSHGPLRTVDALLALTQVFDPDLAGRLRDPLRNAAQDLWSRGTRATLEELTRGR